MPGSSIPSSVLYARPYMPFPVNQPLVPYSFNENSVHLSVGRFSALAFLPSITLNPGHLCNSTSRPETWRPLAYLKKKMNRVVYLKHWG